MVQKCPLRPAPPSFFPTANSTRKDTGPTQVGPVWEERRRQLPSAPNPNNYKISGFILTIMVTCVIASPADRFNASMFCPRLPNAWSK